MEQAQMYALDHSHVVEFDVQPVLLHLLQLVHLSREYNINAQTLLLPMAKTLRGIGE